MPRTLPGELLRKNYRVRSGLMEPLCAERDENRSECAQGQDFCFRWETKANSVRVLFFF